MIISTESLELSRVNLFVLDGQTFNLSGAGLVKGAVGAGKSAYY